MEIGVSRITEKGQVTIPRGIREQRGLTPGTPVVFIEVGDMLILKKTADLEELFQVFNRRARELGLTREELERDVKAARRRTLKKYYGEKSPR